MGISIKEVDVSVVSPMMQHYIKTKEEYKDCILFYRLGDFYEMFFEDAETVSRAGAPDGKDQVWPSGAYVRRPFMLRTIILTGWWKKAIR